MYPSFIKLKLALAVCIGVSCAAPGFAQERDAPVPQAAAPAVTEAVAYDRARSSFHAQGPLYIQIYNFGPEGQRKSLSYVSRSLVASVNTGTVVGGIAAVLLHAPGVVISGHDKEDFYGIRIGDAKQADNLSNPLLGELPALMDQKIADMAGADAESSAKKYKEPLHILAGAWMLAYDELMSDSDNYYLLFRATFDKVEEGEKEALMHKVAHHGGGCNYKSEPKPMSVWRENDYAAVVLEKKKARDSCLDAFVSQLPTMLGMDSDSKIRSAKLSCKTNYSQCIADSDTSPDPGEHKKLCKAEQKQCVSDDVKPLVDMTPLGQCKVTLAECKASVIEKFQATSATGKPDKAEFLGCTTAYKQCVGANKKGSILGIF